jgi:TldD protein
MTSLSTSKSSFHKEFSAMDDLQKRASRDRLSIIARAQKLLEQRILISNGKTEKITSFLMEGVGFQLFDLDGYHSFSSVDTLSAPGIREAYDSAVAGIRTARMREYGKIGKFPVLTPERCSVPGDGKRDYDSVSLPRLEAELREIHRELLGLFPSLRLQTFFQAAQESWTIRRSDGTDVSFSLPRCSVSHTFFGSSPGKSGVSISSYYFTPSYELILDARHRDRVFKRALRAASQVEQISTADHVRAGSHDILIDYALAKGLAHEALGHAAESDSFRSSILARGGKFRSGEVVSSPIVSVIDESIEGDFAYQPFSANGCRRLPVRIINHGVLEHGLTDFFFSDLSELPLTGACRAENYRCIPRPRMSNIRIEVDEAEPLTGEFEELDTEEIRELLLQKGILTPRKKILYLTGYRGGQVNPNVGDFVFNCSAIYEFSGDGFRVFRPALFCGLIMETLKSIKGALGPLKLDAIGICGKWGQNVPSSGGSHYFLFIEKNRNVSIGGKAHPGRSGKADAGFSP